MRKLPYVVECRPFFQFFEAIAAFNSESVARNYARDCAEANAQFAYRVTKGKKVLMTAIGRFVVS